MIVTRSWLEEFIDLDGISDDRLYQAFNSIGLEVDSLKEIKIPDGVVVGRVVSCQKHPQADKLNLCQIDIGGELKQIVCGASNVVNAEFVAVATEGTYLPEIDLEIKPVKLRGVESFGMVCSSSELGLPAMEDGIMILDESIGELKVGKALSEFECFDDTVIELELTANRGDCLSIYGVARDLSAYFDRAIKSFDYKVKSSITQALGRVLSIKTHTTLDGIKILYNLLETSKIEANFLTKFRVSLVDRFYEDDLDTLLKYAMHSSGVVLRAYDFDKLQEDGKIDLEIFQKEDGLFEIDSQKGFLSYIGIDAKREFLADKLSKRVLIEASFINPELVSKATYEHSLKTDELYYFSSRGTNPNLEFGIKEFYRVCDSSFDGAFGELPIKVEGKIAQKRVNVDVDRLNAIIGAPTPHSKIDSILRRLGFEILGSNSKDVFGVVVPPWRHDIENIQDIAEEVLRIIGIDNIPAKPLEVIEQNRITKSILRYKAVRDLRQRATAQGFSEAITYAFSDKEKLIKWGFETVEEDFDLANPIVDELNTLRSTIIINLLEAVKRNINYGKRKVSLFEVGAVFDKNKDEKLKLCIVESGLSQEISILNQGKPAKVSLGEFTKKLASIIGEFEIKNSTPKSTLFHPYLYGKIFIDNKEVGIISKLHPTAQEEFDIGDTFVAEVDLEAILPKHKNASQISNYQGTFKDLSLLIDKDTTYTDIASALKVYDDELIKRFFVIDLYEDESLGEKRSLTIRFFLQSFEGTLSDKAIEESMSRVLRYLEKNCGVELR